jgi:hypothetical protein
MKNLFVLLLFPIIVNAQVFESKIDTVKTKYIGEIRNVLKYKNNLYFYTETENNMYSDVETSHFYQLDSNCDQTKIIVPKELNTFYRDLYTKNDSIFSVEYWNKDTFYLDVQKNKFYKSKQAEDIIYEDKNYIIYSSDFGEFGGFTWFKSKHSNKEFGLEMYFENVSVLDNKYILSNSTLIIEVSNPEKLRLSTLQYKDFNVDKEKNRELRRKIINIKFKNINYKVLYTAKDYFKPEILLHSSFILNKKLFYLYKQEGIEKIGEFINGKFDKRFEFDNDIRIIQYSFDYRNRYNDKLISEQFETSNPYLNGIIDIKGNKIQINYIKNLNEIPILSTHESLEWFKKCFSFYSENIKLLNYQDVANIEKEINSFPILLGKGLNTYRTKEENNLVLTKEYYFSNKNDKLKHLTFFWDYRNNSDSTLNDVSKSKTNVKADLLFKFLTDKFGNPSKHEIFEDNKYSYDWNLSNQNIHLFVSNTRVAVDLENK